MTLQTYDLTIALNGVIQQAGLTGSLKLDETNKKAVLDFGTLTLAQLMSAAGIAAADIASGAISGVKLASAAIRISVVDGENEPSTHQITCTGMAVGDEVIAVLVLATKASIATASLHAGTLTAAVDKITPGTEVNNTNNQYVIFWIKKS